MSSVWSGPFIQKTLAGFGVWCCLCLTSNAVQSANANSVTLQWAANSESDLAGYRVYQGTTAGVYGTFLDVGNVTTYTKSNLQAGLTYYFALTAYDSSGNESTPSDEVNKQISGLSSALITPEITSLASGSTLSGSTETLSWTANGASVTEWWLYVGTSAGARNIYDSGSLGTATSATVKGLPTDGFTLYVRLWYKEGGSWKYIDATYIAYTAIAYTDTIPPSISLTSPINGSSLSGTVNINANATDNIGVVGVQFQLNGTNFGSEDKTNPFSVSWDTRGMALGQYTLTAVARDAAGNTTSSTPLKVGISSPPSTLSVSIVGSGKVTSSPNGMLCTSGTCSAFYGTGSTITLTAKADKKWNFAGWSGACSETGECVIQLSQNQVVRATFLQNGKGKGNN